ncbi:MAG: condensation domain-containing protein, partial [Exilibacterium sp.]
MIISSNKIQKGTSLTENQAAIWAAQKLYPQSPLYKVNGYLTITGKVDLTLFQKAFNFVVEKSDVLRAVFTECDGVPYQRVLPQLNYQLELLDLSGASNPGRRLQDYISNRKNKVFEFTGEMFHSKLFRLSAEQYVWYSELHHLICDGYSTQELIRRVAIVYRRLSVADSVGEDFDRSGLLNDLCFSQFETCLRANLGYTKTECYQRDRKYWLRKFLRPVEPLVLAANQLLGCCRSATSQVRKTQVRQMERYLGDVLSANLFSLARDMSGEGETEETAFAVLMTSLMAVFLYRFSGRADIVLGLAFHNRRTHAEKSALGPFSTVLPLRINVEKVGLEEEGGFSRLFKAVAQEFRHSIRHGRVVANVAPNCDYHAVINYHKNVMGTLFDERGQEMEGFAGLPYKPVWLHPGHDLHPLTVQITDFEGRGELTLKMDCNAALFSESISGRLFRHFNSLLENFVSNPEQVMEVALVNATECRQLLYKWNGSVKNAAQPNTVLQRLQRVIAGHPDAVAVIGSDDENLSLTYRSLNQRASQMAHGLIQRGVGPEVAVAVCIEPSVNYVVATTLNALPDIRQSVVVCRGEEAQRELIAYITLSEHCISHRADEEPGFNISGWNNSYTGESIDPEQMRAWRDATCERIRALRPRNIYEVGCGTGLLLFPLAPYCINYFASDFSFQALHSIEKNLSSIDIHRNKVKLRKCHADDPQYMIASAFDTFVINSVTQYFSSGRYLAKVIDNIAGCAAVEGHIFIGDVRDLRYLKEFHSAVAATAASRGAGPALYAPEFWERIEQSAASEQELLIDPEFFVQLAHTHSRISDVDILLKEGRAANEMNQYRYDVILHLDKMPGQKYALEKWERGLDLEALTSHLLRTIPDCLLVPAVPNYRIDRDLWLAAALQECAQEKGDIESVLARYQSNDQFGAPDEQLSPQDFWDIGRAIGYRVDISNFYSCDRGCYAVLFRRCNTSAAKLPASRFFRTHHSLSPVRSNSAIAYTNNPLSNLVKEHLVGEIRTHCETQLPTYMVPGRFVILNRLPQTAQPVVISQLETQHVEQNMPMSKAAANDSVPLSFAQERLWFLDKLYPGNTLYSMPMAFRIKGQLNCNALEYALAEVIRRHEPLRTVFRTGKTGKTAQIVRAVMPFELEICDFSEWKHSVEETLQGSDSSVEQSAGAENYLKALKQIHSLTRQPFNLENGPLLRCCLFILGDNQHILFINMHHIIVDGWSVNVLMRDVTQFYRERTQG